MAQTFNIVAQLRLQGATNARQVARRLQSQLSSVSATVNINVARGTNRSLNTTLQRLNNIHAALGRVQQAATTAGTALSSLSGPINASAQNINNVTKSSRQMGKATAQTAQGIQQATSSVREFGKQSALAVRRFLAFSIPAGLVVGFITSLKRGVGAAIEFERELIKVSQVTGRGIDSLGRLTGEITRLSTSLGVASEELVDVSRILAQTGLSASDTRVALDALAKSRLAPTFKDMANTAEGAIAIMRQFGVQADQLEGKLGAINALAGRFAVESQDLIFAIRRAGGAFKAAGGDLEELLALFTSVRSTTRETAETIATGFRTIFTRVQRPSTIQFLRQAGIELQNLEGNFVGPFEAVRKLNAALKQLESTDPRFQQIIEELGGFRQVSKVIPLIQQFGEAERALTVARRGQGSLARDAATAQKTLAVQISKVREEFVSLFRELGEDTVFRSFLTTSLSLAKAFIDVAKAVKPLIPLIAGFTAIQGVRLGSQFISGFAGGISGVGAQGAGRGIANTITGGGQAAQSAAKAATLVSNTQALNRLTGSVNQLRISLSRGPRTPGALGPGFQTGGLVPGVGNRDTVQARLQPGEFVIQKPVVEQVGAANLAAMNRGGRVQRFAGGGKVPKTFGVVGLRKSEGFKDSLSFDIPLSLLSDKSKALKKKMEFSAGSRKSIVREVFDIPEPELVRGRRPPEEKITGFKLYSQALGQKDSNFLYGQIASGVIKTIKSSAKKFGKRIDSKVKNINKVSTDIMNDIGFETAAGPIFEGVLGAIGAPYGEGVKAMDFPSGLGSISSVYPKIPKGIPSDAKFSMGRESYRKMTTSNVPGYLASEWVVPALQRSALGQKFGSGKKTFKELAKAQLDQGQPPDSSVLERLGLSIQGSKADKIQRARELLGRARGGLIQRFAGGGQVKRVVGLLDGDVLKDPKNAHIVQAAMARYGIKGGPGPYHDFLADKAAEARKSGGLRRLKTIFGAAGSGKSTLGLGGFDTTKADNARLRKTKRIMILTPEDIGRVTEVVDTRASSLGAIKGLGPGGSLRNVDRFIALSTSTKEEQSLLRANRIEREALTSQGLSATAFGRSAAAAATRGAPVDSGTVEAAAINAFGTKSKKFLSLGLRPGHKLSRKSGTQLPLVEQRKVALAFGAFSPPTTGHLSMMDAAVKAGIAPKDFIAAVAERGDSIKAGDPHSYRTAIFDHKFRQTLAKKSFAGASVGPASKELFAGSIPRIHDVGTTETGQRHFLAAKPGSIAIISKTDPKAADKYKAAGYKVLNLPRTGGISATQARDAITSNDQVAMAKLLPPGALELIRQNQGAIQARTAILPKVVDRAQAKIGRLNTPIEAELAKFPSRLTAKYKKENPEVAGQVAALRKKRDKNKNLLQSIPPRILRRLASMFPQKYGYLLDQPQNFAVGGDVSRKRRLGNTPQARELAKRRQQRDANRMFNKRIAAVYDFDDTIAMSDAKETPSLSAFRGLKGVKQLSAAVPSNYAVQARKDADAGKKVFVVTARTGETGIRRAMSRWLRNVRVDYDDKKRIGIPVQRVIYAQDVLKNVREPITFSQKDNALLERLQGKPSTLRSKKEIRKLKSRRTRAQSGRTRKLDIAAKKQAILSSPYIGDAFDKIEFWDDNVLNVLKAKQLSKVSATQVSAFPFAHGGEATAHGQYLKERGAMKARVASGRDYVKKHPFISPITVPELESIRQSVEAHLGNVSGFAARLNAQFEAHETAPFTGGKLATRESARKPISAINRLIANPKLRQHIPTGSTFLGTGAFGVALETPKGKVIRFEIGGVDRPNIKGQLQALKTVKAGGLRFETLPFIPPIIDDPHISVKKADRIQRKLKNRALDFRFGVAELAKRNIGRGPKGRAVAIDPESFTESGRHPFDEQAIKSFISTDEDGKDLFTRFNSLSTAALHRKARSLRRYFHGGQTTSATARNKDIKLAAMGDNVDPRLDVIAYILRQRSQLLGKKFREFAKGGATTDTVPALLTPGEFVFSKPAVDRIGVNKLHAINDGKVAKAARGGHVGTDGVQRMQGGGLLGGGALGFASLGFFAQSVFEADSAMGKLIGQLSSLSITFAAFNAVIGAGVANANRFASSPGFEQKNSGLIGTGIRLGGARKSARQSNIVARGFVRGNQFIGNRSILGIGGNAAVAGGLGLVAAGLLTFGQSLEKTTKELISRAETEVDLQKAIESRISSERANKAGIGAGIGAALGFGLGGPIGAIIGAALVGGLGSIVGPLFADTSDLIKAFRQTKFDRLGKDLKSITENFLGQSRKLNIGLLSGGAASIGGRIALARSSRTPEERKELLQQLQGDIPSIRKFIERIIDVSDSFDDFETKFGGVGKKLIEQLSVITGRSFKDLKKEIIEETEIRRKVREAAKLDKRSSAQLNDFIRDISNLSSAFQSLNDSLSETDRKIDELFGGGPRFIGRPGVASNIFGRAANRESVNLNTLRSAAEQFATPEAADMVVQVAKLNQDLPQILSQAVSQSGFDDEKLVNRFAQILSGADAGVSKQDISRRIADNPLLASVYSTFLSRATKRGEGEPSLAADIRENPFKFAEELSKTSLQELIKGFSNLSKTVTSTLNRVAKFEDALKKAESSLVTERLGLISRQETALKFTRGRRFDVGDAQRLQRSRQQAILGGPSGFQNRNLVGNVRNLGTALSQNRIRVQALSKELQSVQVGSSEAADLLKRIAGLNLESQRYQQALKDLASSTGVLSALQDKLAKSEERRVARFNLIAEKIVFGNAESQNRFIQDLVGTLRVIRDPLAIRGFSDENKQGVFNFLKGFGEIELPGLFGPGKTAGDELRRIIEVNTTDLLTPFLVALEEQKGTANFRQVGVDKAREAARQLAIKRTEDPNDATRKAIVEGFKLQQDAQNAILKQAATTNQGVVMSISEAFNQASTKIVDALNIFKILREEAKLKDLSLQLGEKRTKIASLEELASIIGVSGKEEALQKVKAFEVISGPAQAEIKRRQDAIDLIGQYGVAGSVNRLDKFSKGIEGALITGLKHADKTKFDEARFSEEIVRNSLQNLGKRVGLKEEDTDKIIDRLFQKNALIDIFKRQQGGDIILNQGDINAAKQLIKDMHTNAVNNFGEANKALDSLVESTGGALSRQDVFKMSEASKKIGEITNVLGNLSEINLTTLNSGISELEKKIISINTVITKLRGVDQEGVAIENLFADDNARGGFIGLTHGRPAGPLARGTDTRLSVLTPGEFVVNANATRKNRKALEQINASGASYAQQGGIQYFAGGGFFKPEDLFEDEMTFSGFDRRSESVREFVNRAFSPQSILNHLLTLQASSDPNSILHDDPVLFEHVRQKTGKRLRDKIANLKIQANEVVGARDLEHQRAAGKFTGKGYVEALHEAQDYDRIGRPTITSVVPHRVKPVNIATVPLSKPRSYADEVNPRQSFRARDRTRLEQLKEEYRNLKENTLASPSVLKAKRRQITAELDEIKNNEAGRVALERVRITQAALSGPRGVEYKPRKRKFDPNAPDFVKGIVARDQRIIDQADKANKEAIKRRDKRERTAIAELRKLGPTDDLLTDKSDFGGRRINYQSVQNKLGDIVATHGVEDASKVTDTLRNLLKSKEAEIAQAQKDTRLDVKQSLNVMDLERERKELSQQLKKARQFKNILDSQKQARQDKTAIDKIGGGALRRRNALAALTFPITRKGIQTAIDQIPLDDSRREQKIKDIAFAVRRLSTVAGIQDELKREESFRPGGKGNITVARLDIGRPGAYSNYSKGQKILADNLDANTIVKDTLAAAKKGGRRVFEGSTEPEVRKKIVNQRGVTEYLSDPLSLTTFPSIAARNRALGIRGRTPEEVFNTATTYKATDSPEVRKIRDRIRQNALKDKARRAGGVTTDIPVKRKTASKNRYQGLDDSTLAKLAERGIIGAQVELNVRRNLQTRPEITTATKKIEAKELYLRGLDVGGGVFTPESEMGGRIAAEKARVQQEIAGLKEKRTTLLPETRDQIMRQRRIESLKKQGRFNSALKLELALSKELGHTEESRKKLEEDAKAAQTTHNLARKDQREFRKRNRLARAGAGPRSIQLDKREVNRARYLQKQLDRRNRRNRYLGRPDEKAGSELSGLNKKLKKQNDDIDMAERTRQQGVGLRRQSGGLIPGVGFGDRVRALLEPGEFVFSRKAVAGLGGPERVGRLHQSLTGVTRPNVPGHGQFGGGVFNVLKNLKVPGIENLASDIGQQLSGLTSGIQQALSGIGLDTLAPALQGFAGPATQLAASLVGIPSSITVDPGVLRVVGTIAVDGATLSVDQVAQVQALIANALGGYQQQLADGRSPSEANRRLA
jgi:TP901 family phage tail tape measure protein